MLTVRFVVFFHEYERVVLDVAEVLDIRPMKTSEPTERSEPDMTYSTRQ